jgi:integrase
MKIKITKTNIENLDLRVKQYVAWDDEVSGFGVRVYPTGVKSYIVNRRIGSGRQAKLKLFVIGPCDLMTPFEARRKAREIIMEARDGNDITKPKALDMTIADVMTYYIENHSVEKKWYKEVIKINRLYIVPALGRKRLIDLDTPDIRDFKDRAGKRSQSQTNKALSYLSAAINFTRGDFKEFRQMQNPCQFVKKFKQKARRIFITFEEMPALLKAINEEENVYARAAIMLYILLGKRKDEILRVRRKDIDFKQKRLYWEDMKNGKEHFLPLGDDAFEIVKMIPQHENSPWLFPCLHQARGWHGQNHLKGVVRSWKRIRENAGLKDKTIHDLRRTFGSWMSMSGENLQLIGKLMGHSGPGVTYDHYAHFQDEPLREALNRHASKVLSFADYKGSPLN